MDRREAPTTQQAARVGRRAATSERVSLSGRRVVHRAAGAHHRRACAPGRAASGAGRRRGVARGPDQGGRRARARHAARSLSAYRHRDRVDHRDRLWPDERNRADRELGRRRPRTGGGMSESFEMLAPDYFTTGAVGQPGQRVFYLQGRQDRTVLTLKVEKEQISALADYVAGLLAKLPEPGTVST